MSGKGFTLIELMIVIGIIGIISAVSLYGWRGYQDNVNLRTAAREVMSDIASCKQRSVSEGVQYCMQFTGGSPNYSINASSCGAPTQTQAKNLTSFGSGLTISSANFGIFGQELRFIPRGTISAGGVIMTNSKGSTATITTTVTGRAHVSFTMR
jgi:prepilin-type N-terminal cleavage/methylation domain-containing protein